MAESGCSVPCYRPVSLARDKRTAVALDVPCGRCIGCRLERSRQWAIRCMHEAQMHEHNCMVTLTFDDEHLPSDGVSVRDLQLFFKRLRKHSAFRYYACGEYGDNFARPHYHALLFGLSFPDRYQIEDSPSGAPQWMSPLLDRTWKQGRCSIGSVTFESAAYVARYVTKKVTGDRAADHYTVLNPLTGELIRLNPEFGTMSRNPGIGRSWFERYSRDVYPFDEVVARGHPSKVPRYYDKIHEAVAPEAHQAVRKERAARGPDYRNSTDERLRVREVCASARLSQSTRRLER